MKANNRFFQTETDILDNSKGADKMKTSTHFHKAIALNLALIIALLTATLPGLGLVNTHAQGNPDDNDPQFTATTHSLTMVYETPAGNSRVANVLMPAAEVTLAGRSLDGKWLAVGNNTEVIEGWVHKSDIRIEGNLVSLPVIRVAQSITATTRSLTMVYETPAADNRVANVLMPAAEVTLSGRSSDGKWLAVGNNTEVIEGWVHKSDISIEGNLVSLPVIRVAQSITATTRSLTMVYQTPAVDSPVANVLMPAAEVTLAGRSSDGKWLALADGNDAQTIKGWIQKSELRTDENLATLTTLRANIAVEVTTSQ
jgi:hypothetical protein